jgi:hypothetical protein
MLTIIVWLHVINIDLDVVYAGLIEAFVELKSKWDELLLVLLEQGCFKL